MYNWKMGRGTGYLYYFLQLYERYNYLKIKSLIKIHSKEILYCMIPFITHTRIIEVNRLLASMGCWVDGSGHRYQSGAGGNLQ